MSASIRIVMTGRDIRQAVSQAHTFVLILRRIGELHWRSVPESTLDSFTFCTRTALADPRS